jgi:FkbM family methyltransferase
MQLHIRGKGTPWSRLVRELSDKAVKGSIVNYRGLKFALVDSVTIPDFYGPYEPWAWKYIYIEENSVVIDVGAHIGLYTIPIAKIAKKGFVVAIEPCPDNFKCLMENVRLNSLRNVFALNIAAWNDDCELNLFRGYSSERHSVIRSRYVADQTVRVRAKKLDEVVKALNLHKITLIKIDVEGAEFQVLKGLKSTLQQFKPDLLVETWGDNEKTVSDFLSELGYQVLRINESEYKEPPTVYIFAFYPTSCKRIKNVSKL